MKKFKLPLALILILMSVMFFSVFGAMPTKPDFAYPKTVSQNAEKELKAALKKQDGPAAVRALLDYGLAQTQINPDNLDKTMAYFSEVSEKLNSPAAKAMIMLAQASAQHKDSLIVDAINRYGDELKRTPTADWRTVVEVDELFFPALYDFAVAQTNNDSILAAAEAYDADRPYPLIYLQMRGYHEYSYYMELYDRHVGERIDIYPLLEMAQRADLISQRREVYDLLTQRKEQTEGISKAIKFVTRPSANVEANSVVGLGKNLTVNVGVTCLNKASLRIEMLKPVKKVVKTCELTFEGSGVFEGDTTLSLTFNEYGEYRITPLFDGLKERNANSIDVTVTDFLLFIPSYGSKRVKPMALDVINGSLQTDVQFTKKDNRTTGARGKDMYSPAVYTWGGYGSEDKARSSANILTDRAIYHPGDTLRFAATIMQAKGMTRKLLSGAKAKVVLRNTNREEVDSLILVSDEYGRVNGEFPLPKNGLTGNYSVSISDYGTVFVLVTDYKAPTFEVELKAARVDSTTVELHGRAIGYNGFPIADAQVALKVSTLPEWVWFRTFRNAGQEEVTTDTVRTDASGKFTVRLTIPANKNLSATATVTSPAGESHDDSAFIPGHKYFIEGSMGQYVDVEKAPKFRVLDAEGNAVTVPLKILLKPDGGDDSKVIEISDSWESVPSGSYTVEITAAGAATMKFRTAVYRRSDKLPPVESALFVPIATAKPGDKLLIGTSYSDSHILMTVWTADSIIEQRWLTPERGNFFIDIDLPEGVDDASMTLLTLHDYRFHEQSVEISRPDARRDLRVEISSMRDRMTPGERELWTIKVTDNLGAPARAAVMADVYCKALDALKPFNWRFNAPHVWGNVFNIQYAGSYTRRSHNAVYLQLSSGLEDIKAQFNLWGESWPYLIKHNYAMSRMMKASATADFGSANMMMMDEAELEEDCVVMESAADTAGVHIRGTGKASEKASEQYRLPEMAVALWKPVLNTAADGSLQIEFEAPDANTTWAVNILAYDKALLSGVASAEVVTSKPVMVQPQLPRFMRVGDRMQFRAMVMNNADSTVAVSSFIEFFDPATDRIIGRRDFNNTLDAMGSAVIAMEITAPDASMIGVRVRATAGNFTDGEQALVAILPNRVDVHTGRPIFMPADSSEVNIDVASGGVVTFTPNAVWECVTALPGLVASESQSALSAAASLFSAATTRGLLRQYPEIGRALKSWEQEDSVLVSRLMKNEDLKLALLESTPFVQASQSETDRRARLLLLFNNQETEKNIKGAINTLRKLQRNGGFAWTQNSDKPSVWITQSVLSTFAQLKRLGYLPQNKELQQMISQALTYLDNEIASDFAKNKNARFPTYVMLRSRFPEVRQSAPARRAAEATVQYLVGHWRDLSLLGVAEAAIILNENNYPTTAHKLIESLRQHEAWAQLPLSPTLLNAFATVEPKCPEVEAIRNEYISRKQSMDWGSGMQVSNLVASILNSGADWLVPASNAISVSVDGVPVEPDCVSFSGEFRLDLSEGGNVRINKGNFPAWGGVFSSSVDSITRVEPFSSEKLKLTRSIKGRFAVGEKVTVTLTLEASQDMDYVIVRQPHCAGMEVVDQLPTTLWLGWLTAYCEPTASATNWFFNRLAKGKTEISQTFYVTAEGTFILAPAEAQSQYAPEFQSHTSGLEIKCQ